MNHGLTEMTLEKIRGVFLNFHEVEKVLLYGSRAKGNYRPGSDIDLALCGQALTHTLLVRIADKLDDLPIPHRIDLSLFPSVTHPPLLDHIRRVGVTLYERGSAPISASP